MLYENTKKVTYLDSCVLIALIRADEHFDKLFRIIDDSTRDYASSDFVRLEIDSKAAFRKREYELLFYTKYFEKVKYWANINKDLMEKACTIGRRYGLSMADACHVSCAASVNAEEILTCEKISKPIHRIDFLKITYVGP